MTFESTRAFFGSKAFVSGNPVRPEFLKAVESETESDTDDRASSARVFVFGGSQGAHAINLAMVEAAPELAAARARVFGSRTRRASGMWRWSAPPTGSAGLAADVAPFFDDMGRQLGRADLIVCRAGATTLAEITAAGKAAILIPLPTATDDHQRKNAEALVAAGAAEMLVQSELTGRTLAQRVLALAADRGAGTGWPPRRARWRVRTRRR